MTRKLIAELIGTFALVFAGTGAIIINDESHGQVTHVGVALTFGLIVAAMIYALGDISGAHINPAVTLGLWLSGKFPGRSIAGFVGAQVAGAVLASVILRAIFASHPTLGTTLPAGSPWQSFVLETILTFLLMLVILRVIDRGASMAAVAPIAIGSVVGIEAMFAGPICGASMNPARSLAPALISGTFQHLWIYLVGPPLGAGLAVLAARALAERPSQDNAVT